jgi:hypothetical protein
MAAVQFSVGRHKKSRRICQGSSKIFFGFYVSERTAVRSKSALQKQKTVINARKSRRSRRQNLAFYAIQNKGIKNILRILKISLDKKSECATLSPVEKYASASPRRFAFKTEDSALLGAAHFQKKLNLTRSFIFHAAMDASVAVSLH